MSPKQTQYVVVACVLALLIAGGSFFFGIKPRLDTASKAKADAAVAETATAQLQADLAGLQQKQADLPTAEKEYKALAAQFPEDFLLSQWLELVQGEARKAGVTISTLDPAIPKLGAPAPAGGAAPAPAAAANPAAAAAGSGVTALPGTTVGDIGYTAVTLNAEGSISNLRLFVKRLTEMDRPLLMTAVVFSTPETGSASVAITGNTFLLRALLTPEEEQALRDKAAADAAAAAAGAPVADPAADPAATGAADPAATAVPDPGTPTSGPSGATTGTTPAPSGDASTNPDGTPTTP